MDWPTAPVLHKVQWDVWDGLVGPPVRDHWGGGPRRWGGPVLSKWLGRDRNISSVVPSCATECSRLRACRVGSSGRGGIRLAAASTPFSGASSVFTRALIGVPGEGLACSGGGGRGGDGGGENSPRPRAGPHSRSPGPLVTLRATVAIPERTGNTRPTSLRGLARTSAVHRIPTPAGVRITDSPRTIPLAVYLPHPVRQGSGRSAV
jgi:hypothetical protein